ncbi:MAG TPA: plasmid stabilization protein, partial [Vicinamibacteria bacterium]|nr:plasmid stabilization protein [Vicinamibacteria bacterium]
MASITIRRLDEKTKARLRIRAAQNGRSMEEEARTLLRAALTEDTVSGGNLA